MEKGTERQPMRTLDFGCGFHKREGAVGADITRGSSADVIANLDQFSYPFRDKAFDLVIMHQVIEHLTDVPGVMEEVWRISKSDAVVEGATPHYSSVASYTDPTHRHHFSVRTFNFLASPSTQKHRFLRRLLGKLYHPPELENRPEIGQKFEAVEVRLTFNRFFRKIGIEWAANIYPELYEAFFVFIPARDIVFRLRTLKKP